MLPWWFWVLLWTVLVLATLLVAVLAGFRLFKRGMAVVEGLGDAADHISAGLSQPGTVVEYAQNPRRYPHGTDATHADPEKIRKLRDKGKAERIEARRLRRIARRSERGQAQNMRDLRLF
ncbi:hypothetical protein [Glutamicibacter mishrai]|uniref:Uncharacterized protein n=1 Tax=Glutamicibacter mishrai TaxID=1775880 RepID=A0A6H0SRA4_9MICC|nr:hypothetical protein [Glutamicibacter mishrai]QIV88507.1 hypothetical protein D3791_16180 [Glutamicibacter mishrai]